MERDESERPRGKFVDLTEEMLYRLSLDGWANESTGDVASPIGWIGRISISREELPEIEDAFGEVFEGAGFEDRAGLIGHWLLSEDNFGFVEVHEMDSEEELVAIYRELSAEYDRWLGEES
jgi:hypothetical protein